MLPLSLGYWFSIDFLAASSVSIRDLIPSPALCASAFNPDVGAEVGLAALAV
jgi:hypothetical protein